MNPINRRVFVKSGAMALLAMGLPPGFLARSLLAETRAAARKKTLVCIFQRGAVDGLSMVVPFGDRGYYAARRSIAIRDPAGGGERGALDLDGFFGLHPALRPLHELYGRGELAVVHAAGSPHPTRSHFEAQDLMERAAVDGRVRDGWLNRVLVETGGGRTLADVGVEVAFADLGGWDTHVAQGGAEGQLARRLLELGEGVRALRDDLGERMEDVVILTMSEFGRTVAENGSGGTDHGHANCMMLLGGGVRGGRVYGDWPGLAPERLHEGRDLAVTTDFRDVFAEVAAGHLGATGLERVFPGHEVDPRRFRKVLG